jgi:hypothetical protein
MNGWIMKVKSALMCLVLLTLYIPVCNSFGLSGFTPGGKECAIVFYLDNFRHPYSRSGLSGLTLEVKERNECENCLQYAENRCKGCRLVYYCSPACQKLDWKDHKVICLSSQVD